MKLSLKNVSKKFKTVQGDIHVMKNFSMEVSAGEFVAIYGKSGCGKSSLLLVAGGLMKPDSGSITIGDSDVYKLNQEERALSRAQNMGFVFQEFYLIPYLTVKDNILAAAVASHSSSFDVEKRASDLMEEFGLAGRAHHLPQALSTGERQRCALARALLNKPKIILADEPTGNLDTENAEIVLKHLRDFTQQGGIVLLATHDARCATYAQKSCQLNEGIISQSSERNDGE